MCAPTGGMPTRQSPRQAGLHGPCVLARGHILGIRVWVWGSLSPCVGEGTFHAGLSLVCELIHGQRVSLCPYVCVPDAHMCMPRRGCPHVLGHLDPGAVLQARRCACGKGVSLLVWGQCPQLCLRLQVPHSLSLFWYTGVSAID